MKVCTKCKKEKDSSAFSKKGKGLQSYCKQCKKEWNEENKERLQIYFSQRNKRQDVLLKRKQYYIQNKERILQKNFRYFEAHKEQIYKQNNERDKLRRRKDSLYKFKQIVRKSVYKAVTKRVGKSQKTEEIIGCSFDELRVYLESQFQEGMTWENQGKGGWHIDHKIPLASAKTVKEVIALCHYTNLQPLWEVDNLKKGARRV